MSATRSNNHIQCVILVPFVPVVRWCAGSSSVAKYSGQWSLRVLHFHVGMNTAGNHCDTSPYDAHPAGLEHFSRMPAGFH
ncbi:unnamed protein product [Allacma fusca]|uniref:Secreted protein n=1 Tax=Allacma fusca TaxID=39272 RepID=A0A8J2JL90_9HEXA|nr:unnamed protein product [Allacma fusca]